MVRIIMSGCNGHMGQVISGLVEKDADAEIVAGIDIVDNRDNGYPVFTDIDACDVEADAMIDFSSAKATDKVLEYCAKKKLPLVLCTTGLSEEQLAKTKETAKELTSKYLSAMNGGSETASESAAEAISEEMVEAMTDSMPLRSLCSFGGFSRAEIQEIIDKLQALC